MTLLDKRIQQDLTEWLSGKEINAAKNIHDALKSLSTKGLPQYFTGKRDAETVLITLNPGIDSKIADYKGNCQYAKAKDKGLSLEDFIKAYEHELRNYGDRCDEVARYDEFDIKQAAFLTHWENSGLGRSQPTHWDDARFCLDAKKNVLLNKLQLELIPYASSQFKIKKKDIKFLYPFIEILLDEVFSHERKYVIFTSGLFEDLFNSYNQCHPGTFDLSGDKYEFEYKTKAGLPGKKKLHCKVIWINYKEKKQKALIAHSFPMRSLNRAFGIMEEYGHFCYDRFMNKPIQT